MNKCLNCKIPVKNKYCSVACQNKHRNLLYIEKYENNPALCKKCNQPLDYRKRKNTFCSSTCSASFNNIGVCRNNGSKILKAINNEDIIESFKVSNSLSEFYSSLGFYKKPNTNTLKSIKKRAQELDLDLSIISCRRSNFELRTKGDLFSKCLNWQSARSTITRHSRKVFNESNKNKSCVICGYNKHIEVAHIKSVSSFDDLDLIADINHIDNLVALCPNHHWEFDNGLLSIYDLQTKENRKDN